MQDRPSREELLQGIVRFLESDLVPVLEEPLRFHTRVAANLLRIIIRETALEEAQLQGEARDLRRLLAAPEPASAVYGDRLREEVIRLNRDLCRQIREGRADAGPRNREVLDHLRKTAIGKLAVANPGIIPASADQTLQEESHPGFPATREGPG
jgi:hypothetical protein